MCCYQWSSSANITPIRPFHFTTDSKLFFGVGVTGHTHDTGTREPNDPQTHIKYFRGSQRYPMCHTNVSESQISVHFTLTSAAFEIQAILKQLHRIRPKMTLNTTRSKVTSYMFYQYQWIPHLNRVLRQITSQRMAQGNQQIKIRAMDSKIIEAQTTYDRIYIWWPELYWYSQAELQMSRHGTPHDTLSNRRS